MSNYEQAQIAAADAPWYPRDAIQEGTRSAAIVGGAGVVTSAVQNVVTRQNVGAMGIFTRFGKTTAFFTAVGGTFGFAETMSSNLRQKEDMWNKVYGAFAAGSIIGIYRRSMPALVANAFLAAGLAGVMAYTGGRFFGRQIDAEEDRIERKEQARKSFRRPINELVNEIGEGRGIYPPGYPDRRAQRIKENYGIDVEVPYYMRK